MIGERQIIGIGLAGREVRQVTLASSFFRNLQKLGTEIDRDDLILRANPRCEGNRGFASSAGQIENFHSWRWPRIVDEGLSDIAAHSG